MGGAAQGAAAGPPFRWVGYDGDENHGCGDHLHLSWFHDDEYREYRPSDWVMTFR